MVIVLVELAEGKPIGVSLELANGAKTIAKGEKVTALVIGGTEDAAKEMIAYGADDAIVVAGDQYASYNSDVVAAAVAQVAAEVKPAAILTGATPKGKDIVPRIAAKLASGCVCDAVALAVNEAGEVVFTVPAYSGNILTDVVVAGDTVVASVRGGSFAKAEPDAAKAGDVVAKDIVVADADIRSKVVDVVTQITESVNLEDAEIIVCGGRGMGSQENFDKLEELATLLGGVVACTRPVEEAGWASRARLVGQSGKIVAPKVYFAFGVSGATQHASGMAASKYIVSINKDEEAPIFEISDLSIVGNALDVLPIMIEEIKKVRG